MSEAMKNQTVERTSNGGPRLWNPTAAANWSLLFTFVFGAWVHAKNWRALNEPKRAQESMIWAWIGIVLLAVSVAGSVAFGQPTGGLLFLFLIAWYFGPARRQIKHVKEELNDEYEKHSWRKPLSWAFGIWGGVAAALFAAGMIGLLLTPIDLDHPDTYVGDYELVAVLPDPMMAMLLDFPLPEDGFRSDRPFEVTVQGHTVHMQVSGTMHLGRESVDAEWSLHTSFPGAAYMSDTTETDTLSGPYTIRDGILIVGEGEDQALHDIAVEDTRMSIELDDAVAVWQRMW